MRINYFRYAHLALGPLRAGIQALEDQNRYVEGPVISIKTACHAGVTGFCRDRVSAGVANGI